MNDQNEYLFIQVCYSTGLLYLMICLLTYITIFQKVFKFEDIRGVLELEYYFQKINNFLSFMGENFLFRFTLQYLILEFSIFVQNLNSLKVLINNCFILKSRVNLNFYYIILIAKLKGPLQKQLFYVTIIVFLKSMFYLSLGLFIYYFMVLYLYY